MSSCIAPRALAFRQLPQPSPPTHSVGFMSRRNARAARITHLATAPHFPPARQPRALVRGVIPVRSHSIGIQELPVVSMKNRAPPGLTSWRSASFGLAFFRLPANGQAGKQAQGAQPDDEAEEDSISFAPRVTIQELPLRSA